MKKISLSLMVFLLLTLLLLGSCKKVFIHEDVANNPQENFDYLWNDIQNRYSYLNYKALTGMKCTTHFLRKFRRG